MGLRYSDHLVGSHLSKMLDSLLSGFQAEAEATARDVESDDNETFPQHRTALEMYAFLMHWFSVAADKFTPKDEDGAAAVKPKVSSLVQQGLSSETQNRVAGKGKGDRKEDCRSCGILDLGPACTSNTPIDC